MARLAIVVTAESALLPGLKIDLDQAHPREGPRFDMVDPAAQGEESLEWTGDVVLDIPRRHPRIEGRDDDDRDLDRRKQIDRHFHHARHPDDGDDEAEHQDQVRIAEGKARHGR